MAASKLFDLIYSAAWLLAPAIAGTWTTSTTEHGSATRTFHVYAPETTTDATGIMMFLHGVNLNVASWSAASQEWGVGAAADEMGFIAVVPIGSVESGSTSAFWNVDDPSDTDEISFLHAVFSSVSSTHSIEAEKPKVALGFSNGAAVSSLLGCHSSTSLWAAHVGVIVNPAADYPSTCNDNSWSTVPVWSGVGTSDYFLYTLTPNAEDGVKNQFQALCPGETWSMFAANNTECYSFSSCEEAGQFCLYDKMTHALTASLATNAWAFLTGVSGYSIRGWKEVSFDKGEEGKGDWDGDWGDKDDGSDKDSNTNLDGSAAVRHVATASFGAITTASVLVFAAW